MLEARLPYHRHLQWLILEGFTFDQVKRFYDNIQIAQPSEPQYVIACSSVERMLMPPITKKRLSRRIYNEGDQSVWRKLGFEAIYLHTLGKEKLEELGRILNHPVMRVALECSLVAGLDPEEIAQMLPPAYSLLITIKTIEIYRNYFFDDQSMTKTDWTQWLNLLVEDRYTYTRLHAALTKPRDEVLHMVGMPTKLQFGTMLKNMMATAYYKFEYYSRQSGPEAQDEARKWGKVMMEAGQKHEKYGATDATDFSNLIQTEFEYLDKQIENVTPEMLADAKPKLEAAASQRIIPTVIIPDQPNDRDDI